MKRAGMIVAVMGVLLSASVGRAEVIFSDDFTGTDNAPLDAAKWDVSVPAGTSVSIQENQAMIHSETQWAEGSFTSKTGADFFAPGSSTTYSLEFREGYTPYGFRHIEVVGSGGKLILEWTTNWDGAAFTNAYTLRTTGSNPQTLWTGTRYWDRGENVSLTLTPTTYALTLYDYNTSQTWCDVSGLHGLAAADFADGGFLKCLAYKNSNNENIYFDNVQFDQVLPPPPALQGTVALDGYTGDRTKVGLTVRLRQGTTVARTLTAFLNGDGTFVIPDVRPLTLGTYDVVVSADAWLTAVVPNVDIDFGTNTIPGTITLRGGDSNGDDAVTFEDFSILQNSYGETGLTAANPLAAAATSGGCGPVGLVLICVLGFAGAALKQSA